MNHFQECCRKKKMYNKSQLSNNRYYLLNHIVLILTSPSPSSSLRKGYLLTRARATIPQWLMDGRWIYVISTVARVCTTYFLSVSIKILLCRFCSDVGRNNGIGKGSGKPSPCFHMELINWHLQYTQTVTHLPFRSSRRQHCSRLVNGSICTNGRNLHKNNRTKSIWTDWKRTQVTKRMDTTFNCKTETNEIYRDTMQLRWEWRLLCPFRCFCFRNGMPSKCLNIKNCHHVVNRGNLSTFSI